MTSEIPISNIPETEITSGDSLGSMIQLKNAPETGIRNFQIFSSETLTDGRRSSVFQIEIAAADKKLSQARATKYSGGKTFLGNPSKGKEITRRNKPPKNNEDEVKTKGEILCFLRATTTLVIPETRLFSRRKITPVSAISAPAGRLLRPSVIIATPVIPSKILANLNQSIRSFAMVKCAIMATNKGDEPTIMAEIDAGTRFTPR